MALGGLDGAPLDGLLIEKEISLREGVPVIDVAVRVTNQAGAPVRAELSLSVADEGVLQLIGYRTPSPMSRFFAPWGIGVQNATNWTRIGGNVSAFR